MSTIDENEDREETFNIPSYLPGLDDLTDGSDSDYVLEKVDTILLSNSERMLADGMLCESEPRTSDDDLSDSLVLLSTSKNHPDNQPFVVEPIGTVDLINNNLNLDNRTERILGEKAKVDTTNILCDISNEDLSDRLWHLKVAEQNDLKNNSNDKMLRTSNEKHNYNEKSEDDGDYSATDGSDYIYDSDENKSIRKRKKNFIKNNKSANLNKKITVQALVHVSENTPKMSCARVLVPETPETSFKKNNSRRSILFCNESIEEDAFIINSDDRILGEKAKDDTTNILHEVPNEDLVDILNNKEAEEQIFLKDIVDPSTPKSGRSWKRRNCCIYCENLVTNFTRHLKRKHPEEIEVIKLMAITDQDLKMQKKKRQAFTDDLRNRGNYLHNTKVVSCNEGHLIPNRQKSDEELTKSPSSFVVCKRCLGTYKRSTFYRHSKKCNPQNENDFTSKHILAQQALSIIPNFRHVSKEFLENILPKLRNDEISLIVKQDPLIVAYGCRLLKKKKERRSRKSICSKIRDLAHILRTVREKHPEIAQLKDLIDPLHYEHFIEAVKTMSGFNEETGIVKIISMPARIRPEILGCIEILYTSTIMDNTISSSLKEHVKNKLNEFKILLEANWQWEISSNAEKSRKRNLMTKPQIMPNEKDIEKLMAKIHELEEKYYKALKGNITIVNYENLCEVTISHIILLDRKRSGDVAEAELQFYINRKTDEIPVTVLKSLSEKQMKAMSELDIFQIPGKRGRPVPILLTKIMGRNIDLLIACRSALNISRDNKYLFARPLTEEPFDGGRCLNTIKKMCTLKNPEMLTSTGLRHHIATISQVDSGTDDKYTQHLATFLGHDLAVHSSNYRLPLQAIQKGLVGSRLMEVECTNKNNNEKKDEETDEEGSKDKEQTEQKNAKSIIYDDETDEGPKKQQKRTRNVITSEDETDNEEPKKRRTKVIISEDETDNEEPKKRQISEDETDTEEPKKRQISEDETDNEETKHKQKRGNAKQQKRKKTHTKWSTAEINAVMRHFKSNISKKKNPGKALCEAALRQEPALNKRTWMQINTYVNNIYKKNL